MAELLGITPQALFGQLLVGLINGSFYAILSLGLAIIFGLLNIINFTHGAQYMMGAFIAWIGFYKLGEWVGNPDLVVNYWWSLLLAPLAVGAFGILIEKTLLKRLYHLDHLYGLLLTFGIALICEGLFRTWFGISGLRYDVPAQLTGGQNLGFMFMPNYRAWVVVASLAVCFVTWFVIERTKLGSYLRAGTENPRLLQAFGINVPLMITLTYGYGVALAAFAGVLAAPIFQVNPLMGSNLIIVVFAVVVIGGMGSIAGAIVTGVGLGLIEGVVKSGVIATVIDKATSGSPIVAQAIYPVKLLFQPEASAVIIFVVMVIVLLVRPAGLFGREK
ncbi:MAG: branched-chain amino acid ABC transporter permease [Proteobacteria bacterium]|nr:branched-chain amino acid ABC transporter permease [Burkholderiales bacterium]